MFLFQAESAADQMDWVEKITGVIASLLSSQSPEQVWLESGASLSMFLATLLSSQSWLHSFYFYFYFFSSAFLPALQAVAIIVLQVRVVLLVALLILIIWLKNHQWKETLLPGSQIDPLEAHNSIGSTQNMINRLMC